MEIRRYAGLTATMLLLAGTSAARDVPREPAAAPAPKAAEAEKKATTAKPGETRKSAPVAEPRRPPVPQTLDEKDAGLGCAKE